MPYNDRYTMPIAPRGTRGGAMHHYDHAQYTGYVAFVRDGEMFGPFSVGGAMQDDRTGAVIGVWTREGHQLYINGDTFACGNTGAEAVQRAAEWL